MNVVINRALGGLALSRKAVKRYSELSNIPIYAFTWEVIDNAGNLKPAEKDDDSEYLSYSTDPKCTDRNYWDKEELDRDDPILVQVVNELGKSAGQPDSDLVVISIPDDVDYYVEDCENHEVIREKSREWN